MTLRQDQLQDLLGPRYRLLRELGGGSMAVVYLAEDSRHGRQVAVKVLRPEYAATFAAERFFREIEIAARLQHPHIVPLLDSGEAGGLLYLVMPYIEGETLRDRLSRESTLPVREVIRILADVADALAYAHEKGVVHRDIKPDNILLAGRHALVADFGVAKAIAAGNRFEPDAGATDSAVLTQGLAIGTPAYMAPEQALAEPDLDQRVDLYALGVVGFELLTGKVPFEGPTTQSILAAQVLDAPPPVTEARADTPPALAVLIDRCLAKSREDRWQRADELVRQLEPLATPSGGSTPASVTPVAPVSSMMWLVPLVVVLGGLGLVAYLTRREPPAQDLSESQITFNGSVKASAISPDGQFLAFVAESAGTAHLMVQERRGGRAIRLNSASRIGHISWSSDGSEIRTFMSTGGASFLQVVPRLGGATRSIRVAPWTIPSPDGTMMFDLPQGKDFLRFRNTATGTERTAPLETGWWYSPPAWSLDGRWVAFAEFGQRGTRGRIIVVSATDLHQEVVLDDTVAVGAPSWDGRKMALYYLRGPSGLVDLYHLDLKPSGEAAAQPRLVRAGLSIGTPSFIASFPDPVSVTADGSQVVYTQRHEWSNIGMISLADWKRGAAPIPLTTGSAQHIYGRLSPDGRRLAVVRLQTVGGTVRVIPVSGGEAQDLGEVSDPLSLSWSLDGQKVMVQVSTPDSGLGVKIFSTSDLTAQTRYYPSIGGSPAWLNDSTVVAPRAGNRTLQLLPLRGGTPQLLPGVDTSGWMLWPVTSRDGRYVAYAWNPGKGNGQSLHAVRMSDASDRQLLNAIMMPVAWSQDNEVLFAQDISALSDSAVLVALPREGGPLRELGIFPAGFEVEDVTADGSRVLLLMGQHRSDAWVIHPR